MAERTVKLAGITYRASRDVAGFPVMEFAQVGEVVDVHEEDVERFDRLNDQYESGAASGRVAFREEVARNDPAGPRPTDHGAGSLEDRDVEGDGSEDEDVLAAEEDHQRNLEPKRPRTKANLAEWQDYAEAVGVEIQDDEGNFKTKATLIEETADVEEEEDDEVGV
jgi:hypothetical protein